MANDPVNRHLATSMRLGAGNPASLLLRVKRSDTACGHADDRRSTGRWDGIDGPRLVDLFSNEVC